MKLTIIVPAYNSGKTISKCIDSIIQSKSDEFECIIVNDGSIDNTKEIVENYANNYNQIRLINTNNKGVSNARNIGLYEAKGEYITFIDSDDYYFNYSIDLILEKLIVDADMYIFSYLLNKQGSYINKIFDSKIIDKRECIKNHVVDNVDLNTCWGKIYKKEIIIKNKVIFPIKQKIGEDAIFVLSYLSFCENIAFFSEMILVYNFISGNTMSNYKIDWFNDYIEELHVREKITIALGIDYMNIYSNYIDTFFLFFISYSQIHKISEISDALDSIPVNHFRLKIIGKYKPLTIYQKIKYYISLRKNYIVIIIYKLLGLVKVIKNMSNGLFLKSNSKNYKFQ